MNIRKHILASLIIGFILVCLVQVHLIVYERQTVPVESEIRGPLSVLQVTSSFAQPLPEETIDTAVAVALGELLFADRQLSRSGEKACIDCHQFSKGGTDHLRYSPTIAGGFRSRNTPSIFNVAYVYAYNWDGGVSSLEKQVDSIISSPNGLGAQWPELLRRLETSENYREMFSALGRGGITRENVIDALCAYERSLVTPDSDFDRFLRGEQMALSPKARKGLTLFVELGCSSCHQGIKLGDNIFTRIGVFGDYFKDRGHLTKADYGRYNITANEEDRFVFRVPGLRNVARTYPYFHDGSVAELHRAVDIMANYQLGRRLTPEEVDNLAAFLEGLTGKYRGSLL